MKAIKWMGTAAMAALFLLTSCLGDSDNTMSSQGFAVGGVAKNYKPIVYTAMGQLHSQSLAAQTVTDGCYIVNYSIDFNAPENENAALNGYYVATINVGEEITKGQFIAYSNSDTTKLEPNEIVLKNIGASPDFGVYLGGHLFLLNAVDMVKEQKNNYTLYWDRSKEPVDGENGLPMYSLFLRASKYAEGTGTTVATGTDVRAFDIHQVVESINTAEKNKGSKGYILKINYLTGVSQKDSTDLKWNSLRVPMAVQ